MKRARSSRDLLAQARPLIRPALYFLSLLLIASGRFDHFAGYGAPHYVALAGLLVVVLFEIMTLIDQQGDTRRRVMWLGAWTMAGMTVATLAAGRHGPALGPLSFIIFAVAASSAGLRRGAMLWLMTMALVAGHSAWAGRADPDWPGAGIHGAYLAAFGLAMGLFVSLERRSRQRAERALDDLKRDVSEFQRDDTVHRLSGLTDQGRKSEAVRSVFALDEAFHAALEAGREAVEADALALYWRAADGPFHLREVSASDEINAEARVAAGSGLLGWVAAEETALRVSGPERLKGALPYRGGAAVEHLVAVPVLSQGRLAGVLAADRKDGNGFSAADEKLMNLLADKVADVHSHALLMKLVESEAAQFKSLAELSHRLSQSLDLAEIFAAVLRMSQAITGHDAAAIVLPGDDGAPVVAAAGGDIVKSAEGQAVVEGTLAGWVIAQKQYLSIPDLAERTRKTWALGQRLDPSGMKSALIHPLPLKHSAQGALALFSREPDAFGRYMVRVSGILADIAAVAIHNALLYREMEQRAVTDGLTGLYNHRWFQGRLTDEIERAGRLGTRLAVVLSDIDHFKKINDAYGHPVGDEVLKGVAALLCSSVRKVDSAARYGGEEFALILVGAGEKGARELAERVRKNVAKLRFHADGKEFKVSLSLGVAVYPDDATEKESLIELSDQALYRAKESGRNRTVMAAALNSEIKENRQGAKSVKKEIF
ncbi:MAG TPA: diguanylate cyclase [bacterium]|nr:diguanylate cyclase [bacterium]